MKVKVNKSYTVPYPRRASDIGIGSPSLIRNGIRELDQY